MKTFRNGKLLVFAGILGMLALVASPVRADWDPSMPTKYVQLPDLNPTGLDVNATFAYQSDGTGGWPFVKILADDFPCTTTGPITDIHVWGSWLNDQVNPNTQFKLSIHDDVPAPPTGGYSHPGTELWSRIFTPGSYLPKLYAIGTEQFYEPNTDEIIGADTQVWLYNFLIPETDAFMQQGSSKDPKVYWLDVQAIVPAAPAGTFQEVFGWKTSRDHWNDDATFADTEFPGGPLVSNWRELRYPIGHQYEGQSIDLSFAITTIPEPGTMLLLVTGLVGLLVFAWRRRR